MYTKMLNDEVKSIVKDIQKGLHKCFVKEVAEWKSSARQKSKQISDWKCGGGNCGHGIYIVRQVEDDGHARWFYYLDKLSNWTPTN